MRGIALALVTLTSALAAPPQVVTDTPVTQSLTAMVMAGVGTPTLLLDKGADPHDFQLRPSQAAALEGAGLVVWIGPEMTPWLATGVQTTGRPALELLSVPGTVLRQASGDEEEHEDGTGQDHEQSHTGGRDPHAWLDPRNAATWVAAIAGELAKADPDNAAAYAANATAAQARIIELDADLAHRLEPARAVPLGVYHDAYGYLAARYGLTIAGSIAQGDAHDPGAAHLAALEDDLKGALCIFPEAGHDARAAETLASDTGLRIGPPLDPEGLAMDPGPGLYPALMTALADGILACVRGG
jgi:zinc transport system substrate-binding protein